MPLNKKGEQLLRSFKKRYGRKNGEHVFMGYLNNLPEEDRKKFEK